MQISTSKGNYDLPHNFEMNIEFINPMLDNVGSQSLPCNMPYTDQNILLADYPRMDRNNSYITKRNVTIREGGFVKEGSQVIFSASRKEGIVSTIYFDEAIFYEKINNVKLQDLYNDDEVIEFSTTSEMITKLDKVLKNEIDAEYHIFPVAVGTDFSNVDTALILNDISISRTRRYGLITQRGTTKVNGEEYDVPMYFGITPFLKVREVLNKIANRFGGTLSTDLFEKSESWNTMCLLNNVADAFVNKKVRYKDLLPTCTVGDFLKSLFNKFGLKFLYNEFNKTFELIFIKDILTAKYDLDLTPYITDEPIIEWKEKEALVLKPNTTITGTEPICEFFDQLIKVHNTPSLKTGVTYTNYLNLSGSINVYTKIINNKKVLIQAYEGYRTDNTSTPHEIQQIDASVGCVCFHQPYASSGDEEWKVYYPFIDQKVKMINTAVQNSEEEIKAEEIDTPIMFCFKQKGVYKYGSTNCHIGTTGCYDFNGNKWGEFNLSINTMGLLRNFWTEYDHFISESNYTVKCELRIPLCTLQMLKLHTPKLLNGQQVLIERIKCKISNNMCEITDATFRTIKSYH